MTKLKNMSSLPTQSWFDEVNDMILLDDILLVKGHPKSKEYKNEKPYARHERLNKIIEVMDISIQRTIFMNNKYNGSFARDPITERRKILKQEYKLGISLLHMDRRRNLHERLEQVIQTIIKKPYKVRYRGNVIPHPDGIYATAWTSVKKLVDVHSNTYQEYPEKLGRVSEKAVKELTKRKWPIEQTFEFIVEPVLELREIGISTDNRYPNPRAYCETGKTKILVVIDEVMY